MQDLSEEELIRLAIAGDSVAQHTVLIPQQMRLFRYVCSEFPTSLGGFTTPEDIVQDVYVKAFANIGKLRATAWEGVFAWMAAIARNTIIDMQRRYALRRPADLENDDGEDVVRLLERLVLYRRTPSQSAAEHEFMRAVEDSLEELSDNYRQVVRLRHMDGLSVAETSERMNISSETVHKLCNRGLTALRARLEQTPKFS